MSLRSEYAGQDGPTGLPWRGRLSASEKLRLIYTTGTESALAPFDGGRAFRGVSLVDPLPAPHLIPTVTEDQIA